MDFNKAGILNEIEMLWSAIAKEASRNMLHLAATFSISFPSIYISESCRKQ